MVEAAEEITRQVHWLDRRLAEMDDRHNRAAERGFELATIVRHYLENPEAVGSDALRSAYGRFMAAHSGNFGPSC